MNQPDSDPEKHYTILIVDDLPSNRDFLVEVVSGFGYHTMSAEGGKEALARCDETVPDLILTDVHMPEMDGFELCDQLKSRSDTADIPIILVTAETDRSHLVLGLNKGADDFLIKPVHISELQSRVRNLLLVKDYRDHMKDYTSVLEDKVKARTMELHETLRQLKEANVQLQTSTLDTIQRLSIAAEYRDPDTAAHIWRQSHYAQAIAMAMDLDQEYCDNILYASPMHDIGKIGTPDHILLKPALLSSEEIMIMRDHTSIGERILRNANSGILQMAQQIAGHHHEWWNGVGYPRSLAGKKIPLAARIVAVADVFDALTTRRVYKEAWNADDAFSHIEKNAGIHFDPQCVHAFFLKQSEILAIKSSRDVHLP